MEIGEIIPFKIVIADLTEKERIAFYRGLTLISDSLDTVSVHYDTKRI